MVSCGKNLFWILVLPCLFQLQKASFSRITDDKALAKMKQQWEECCRSNETLCIKSSCYSMEWRAAAWAAVRNRCRGRFSDWPFAVDIMKVQDEKDIEALWKLLSIANAYPNQNSALPVTVWTSGTRCPQRGPSGIIVSTKWASNQPFPSWLEEKVNNFPPLNDTSFDDSCKFMVITPESNRTASFDFVDENAKYAAVCEFLFPDVTDWTDSTTIDDTSTTITQSPNCTGDTTDPSFCEEDENTTHLTFATLPFTDSTNDSVTLNHSMTTTALTNGEKSSADGKDRIPTTEASLYNRTETATTPNDNRTIGTPSSLSNETVSDTIASHSEFTEVSTNATTVPSTESTSDSTTESHTETTPQIITDSTTTGYSTQSISVVVTESTTKSTTTSTALPSVSTSVKTTTEREIRTSQDFHSIGCKERNASGIRWPTTPPGKTVNQSCPDGMTGYAQWKCDEKTLTFVPEKPSIHNCRHVWIDELEDEINDDGNAVEISSKLANKTKDSVLSHGDIAGVVELAENLMELFVKQKYEKESQLETDQVSNMTYDFTKSFVATYSNVLQTEHSNAWNDLPQVSQRFIASKILRHTEIVGQVLSCIKMTEDNVQYTVLEDNINLQTFMFNSSEKRSVPYVFPKLGPEVPSSEKIVLPSDLTPDLWPSSCPDAKTALGIVYKNVGQFLREESEEKLYSDVSSSILGFTLGNSSDGSLRLPRDLRVTIFLKHTTLLNKRLLKYKTPRCVFWNFSRGNYGEWDDSGCNVVRSNFSHTVCSCDHLTNFAILMDVNNNVGGEDLVLEMMTYICCGLSTVALTVTLICLIGIRSIRCRRNTITCNLCACLLVMNILVIFGLDRTENEILCAVIAGLLHYSVLSVFCWMLLEAYQLYQMVILVFRSSKEISIAYFYLFGYGVPLVIVGTSAGMRHEDYGGPDGCWLSNENGLMWSFAGPACVIIMVNLIVFIMTIRSASSVKIRKEQKTMDKVKSWVKGSLSILCLLGLTWVTGLLYMVQSLYFASYIFIVLNGLQGVFIFIFHVLLNEKTGSFFRKMFKKKMIVRQTTKSTTVPNGTSSSERRRSQLQNGTNAHGEVRSSYSLSQQNLRRHSAISHSVSSITAHISNSQDSRGHYVSRANGVKRSDPANALRMKTLSSDSPNDISHGLARGVVRQLKRSHHKDGE